MLNLAFYSAITFDSNCRKFCDSWNVREFLLQGIAHMLTDGLHVTPEKRSKLLPRQPHRLSIGAHLQSRLTIGAVYKATCDGCSGFIASR